MTEEQRKDRNAHRLTQLYPTFRERIRAVIAELEAQGQRPRIQDAYRSPEDQLKAYRSGHSQLRYGFHNVTSAKGQPEALAVDMLDENSPANEGREYLLRLAAAAEKFGLVTGIRWGLGSAMRAAIDRAIADRDWKAPVKVGWDPAHVEAVGITPTEARAGKRPK